jgi:hypothetical protein
LQEPIPVRPMSSRPDRAQPHLVWGAVLRMADMRVSIRVQQSGGAPTHAPLRRGPHHLSRPPPGK